VHDIKMKHKSNSYEIGFKGDIAGVIEKLNGHCQVMDQYENGGNQYVKIMAEERLTGNELLSLVLPCASVASFNEVIPTMNEIFINVVEAQNQQNPK
jgi:ABC-2 type transport system ATP-binding protein